MANFSAAQRDLISDILEARRRRDTIRNAYISGGGHEAVFVKTQENVRGDERAAVLTSGGEGPCEAVEPLDTMAFAPVSTEGGERQLNVLVTRAPVRRGALTTFAPRDIDIEQVTGEDPPRSSVSSSSQKPASRRKAARRAEGSTRLSRIGPPRQSRASPARPVRKSARPGSRSASLSAIGQGPAAIRPPSSAVEQSATRPFRQGNATGWASRSRKDSAGGFTELEHGPWFQRCKERSERPIDTGSFSD